MKVINFFFVLALLLSLATTGQSAAAAGSLCALKPEPDNPSGGISEVGAFAYGESFTPEAVSIGVDGSELRKVSATEPALFSNLALNVWHTVAIYSYDKKKRLQSFKVKLTDESPAQCLWRKPVYGSWSLISPGTHQCQCPND
ncbi:MAG: hypothetical protein LBE24_04895 [Methylobacillus sp.]|jgi:hypothetical protein|nr:hypothetical protein [Methylobacillus sp.]